MARADDERVLAAAQRVLETHRTVATQKRFGQLVARELEREVPGASVMASRVRRLVASAPFCRLEYDTREGSAKKALNRCPVCGAPLERVKNQTLFGGEVTLVQNCSRCRYRTGKKKRVPTYYAFHWRP
jgi:hypothetical protein